MNKKSGCELVRNGTINYAPKNYKDKGRPNCYGYIDQFKDTELAECKKCPWFYLQGGDYQCLKEHCSVFSL